FPIAVTFDDDLASHLQLALPILRRTGVQATFFLTGATLRGPFSFWWERLQRAVDADEQGIPQLFAAAGAKPPVAATRSSVHALGRIVEGLDPNSREVFAESLPAPEDPETGLSADGVRALADAGMS